jgi:hypothetical protein
MKALFKIYLELESELLNLKNASLNSAEIKAEQISQIQCYLRSGGISQIEEKVKRDEISKLSALREGHFMEAKSFDRARAVLKEKMLEHIPE